MNAKNALDLTALRATAEAATPGPWHWAGNTDTGEVAPNATTRADPKVYRADITDVCLPDAQHIATFSPATVLALLDEIEHLRTRVLPPAEGRESEAGR